MQFPMGNDLLLFASRYLADAHTALLCRQVRVLSLIAHWLLLCLLLDLLVLHCLYQSWDSSSLQDHLVLDGSPIGWSL